MICISTQPHFSSINLSQAVLLACYNGFNAHNTCSAYWHIGKTEWSSTDAIHALLQDLEQKLDTCQHWRTSHKKGKMWVNLRNLFWRTPLTQQEVRTLRGVFRSLFEHTSPTHREDV